MDCLRFCTILALTLFLSLNNAEGQEDSDRSGNFFSMFDVVRFRNSACNADGDKNGTCFTKQECEDKGGVASGTCAEAFGVCCVLSVHCGGTIRENCTYFDSDSPKAGSCEAKVCPTKDICQLRLDFDLFSISGPSTTTRDPDYVDLGGFFPMLNRGQCLTDAFRASSSSSMMERTQTICGINTGEHMYVDADPDNCNSLKFQLGNVPVGISSIDGRGWSIKVTQYACEYENLAPAGCTQYFYGSDDQTVRTYNFQGGLHLADQRQKICVRRERNVCKLCWTPVEEEDFRFTDDASGDPLIPRAGLFCCNFFFADCVMLEGQLENPTGTETEFNSFCGGAFDSDSGTVCQKTGPFGVSFISDQYELIDDDVTQVTDQKGFQLKYIQRGC